MLIAQLNQIYFRSSSLLQFRKPSQPHVYLFFFSPPNWLYSRTSVPICHTVIKRSSKLLRSIAKNGTKGKHQPKNGMATQESKTTVVLCTDQ